MNPKLKLQFVTLFEKTKDSVHYHAGVPYNEIHKFYQNCDLFVFASTCENMPNILLEAMKSGIPILCSNYGPMPEILRDAGLYFDPLNVQDFFEKVQLFMSSEKLRAECAQKANVLANEFSWSRSSRQTFDFIESCLHSGYHKFK